MKEWFNKQSKLVQILLLLIPVVNWIVEIIIRWEIVLKNKKAGILALIIAIIVTIPGLGTALCVILGILDLIFVLLNGHLFLAK